ncbi:molybdopterin-guanine dinucleotide biosynthesis protein MobB [Mucilaginibacter conchicola]|uniref:Molybdopterin-guanine dinucleotide biosynthesis protein MobB n=1 Tax=Mucilaginibacter conchicola TaxID=2303333 RepID=A0A372NXL9_9SPHI|nr:DUF5712 family protein [Mucilaginibacter conchicola]RFZ94863.1 molybdopterin-guanine dinucleotide biosynthesis protein MobB [Mucilaginibacter conchicola]
MHINITKSEAGNNKGSCSQLVAYLEKENRLAEALDKFAVPEYWFSHQQDDVQAYEVRQGIDNNIAKLSRDDAKFFLVNISPSEKELLYLEDKFGDKAGDYLKVYAKQVMDAYAGNFKRSGVESGKDLVYFGKLEHNRYYTYKDLEVRKGKAKRGEVKPGRQMHVQIIVSRKDASNSIKLSPLNNSKGKNAEHSLKVGQFDRVAFKQAAESLFDRLFDYTRTLDESFKYANTLKNGSYEERKQMNDIQLEWQAASGQKVSQSFPLLKALLEPEFMGPPAGGGMDEDLKRRKKKKRGLGQGSDQYRGPSM